MTAALLMPVFVQVALTFLLLFWLASARSAASSKDSDLLQKTAIDTSFYPKKVQQIAKCFDNQLQLPILFYSVIAFTILLALESTLMISLAWVFVGSRLVHAIIHTGPNAVIPRFLVFLVGTFSLITMWVVLGLKIYGPVM